MREEACRFCGNPLTISLVDLGSTPLANNYLPDIPEIIERESVHPLHVKVCGSCYLAQITDTVDPTEIFNHDYAYLSSYSRIWVEHARTYTERMIKRFDLDGQSRVVEIASNDGYLLQHFAKAGIPVLGVEPAGHAAHVAKSIGVNTCVDFFNESTALRLKLEGITADLMVANNVLAHVPDIRDFIKGFAVLLRPEGVVTFEFPHLLNLISQVQFDTIYHEHYSYLSLMTVERVLDSVSLRVFDVEVLSTHGGSLRVFACHDNASHQLGAAVDQIRQQERGAQLDRRSGYEGFTEKVQGVREAFRRFLKDAKKEGKSVAAYGAAAKGNTFLNYCGINASQVQFVVDHSEEKQGRLLPGSHIPIYAPDKLAERRPDYVVILPWNLTQEITQSHDYIGRWGGRFVVAVPELKVL